jgi:hypothetical protein
MAKLFVIFARDVPTAVILRRGPTDWYHVLKWETDTDAITPGAWIRGRIYEESCDLSPDGRLLLYFVRQASRGQTEFSDSWTAISRVPWLSALVLWPHGGPDEGGGRFINNQRVKLRSLWSRATHRDFPLRGLKAVQGKPEYHRSSEEVADAEWSGRDQLNRLVFTRHGQLYRQSVEGDQLIADLTDLMPDPQPAPEWASRPLR